MLPIAVQLYSLRNLDMPFDEVLGKVAEIGYTGVETVGNHNLSADEMNALLTKHGLKAVSAHVAISAMDQDLDTRHPPTGVAAQRLSEQAGRRRQQACRARPWR